MRMKIMARLIVILIVLGALAGCAAPEKIDAAPGVLSKISTVAVIAPPEPKIYPVVYFGHPGLMFGLIGGIAAAADQSSKQEQLSLLLRKEDLSTTQRIANEVASTLSAMGYQSRVEQGPWEPKGDGYVLEFEKIKSDADAVAVVTPTIVGFIAPGVGSDYLPTITTVVTLLGADRKTPLYRGFHVYGWDIMGDAWKRTPPNKTFPNFAALTANPGDAAKSLVDAAMSVSQSIASDLKR